MEDDEEIMSHHSGGSGSPGSPSPSPSPSPSSRENGRIIVTVAAAPPPPPPPQNSLTLALPVDPLGRQGGYNNTTMGVGGGGGGGGREDCWSEGATSVLIDAWGERYLELSRGNLKQKHWQEVADIVSSREDYRKTPKTDIQCKNRIDTVKKKYKTEKQKMAAGCGPSRWPFFQRLDELIGSTTKINTLVPARVLMPGLPMVTPVQVGFSGAKNVPMGIPVGVRPMSIPLLKQPENFRSQLKPIMNQNPNPNLKTQLKSKGPVDMDTGSDESEPNPEQYQDSSDGFPPEPKRARIRREMMNAGCDKGRMTKTKNRNGANGNGGGGEERSWGNSVRELTGAILKFGEAYEQAESSKLQQLMEMEKQRMKFAKELELQRMQFFMKTQLELSQLKPHRRVESSNHNSNTNNISNNNNNSDSSD